MIKNFYNKKTGQYYNSLKEAKSSSKFPYVYRTWLDDEGNLIDMEILYAYGDSVCTIRIADQIIEKRIINQKP